MQALYQWSRKSDEDAKKKIKKIKRERESTLPTSISNTVADAALFEPDAGLQECRGLERGREVRPGKRSEALWEKMWSELSVARKR